MHLSFSSYHTLSGEYSIQLMASILRRGCINSIIRSYTLVGSMTRDVVKERSQRVRPEIMESFQSHGPVEVGHAYFITRSFLFVLKRSKGIIATPKEHQACNYPPPSSTNSVAPVGVPPRYNSLFCALCAVPNLLPSNIKDLHFVLTIAVFKSRMMPKLVFTVEPNYVVGARGLRTTKKHRKLAIPELNVTDDNPISKDPVISNKCVLPYYVHFCSCPL